MRLKEAQIERFVHLLLKTYQEKELIVIKANLGEIQNRLKAVIERNFSEEEKIEEEARRMTDSLGRESKEVDPHKMFLLIKKKLAEKKGFIL